jgi:hypothetical protein
MVKRADSVAKRWDELVSSGIGVQLAARLKKLEEEVGADANATVPDWVDPPAVAFSLNTSKIADQAVTTAFDKAGLDSQNPIHW